MKYFKVTNKADTEDEFYVSSTLPNETPTHLAMTLHLGEGDDRYDIVEVDKEEFDRETEDEDYGGLSFGRDFDCDGDWDWEDKEPECFD